MVEAVMTRNNLKQTPHKRTVTIFVLAWQASSLTGSPKFWEGVVKGRGGVPPILGLEPVWPRRQRDGASQKGPPQPAAAVKDGLRPPTKEMPNP